MMTILAMEDETPLCILVNIKFQVLLRDKNLHACKKEDTYDGKLSRLCRMKLDNLRRY